MKNLYFTADGIISNGLASVKIATTEDSQCVMVILCDECQGMNSELQKYIIDYYNTWFERSYKSLNIVMVKKELNKLLKYCTDMPVRVLVIASGVYVTSGTGDICVQLYRKGISLFDISTRRNVGMISGKIKPGDCFIIGSYSLFEKISDWYVGSMLKRNYISIYRNREYMSCYEMLVHLQNYIESKSADENMTALIVCCNVSYMN